MEDRVPLFALETHSHFRSYFLAGCHGIYAGGGPKIAVTPSTARWNPLFPTDKEKALPIAFCNGERFQVRSKIRF